MDLLARFIHVEQPTTGTVAAKNAARMTIFPRYHQWDAVMKLEADAKTNGAGQSYLIEHSAGSGKSNTIAWAAHRFSNLHDADDKKVFDKVIVITDRVILDQQLQDTIYQFEHAPTRLAIARRRRASTRLWLATLPLRGRDRK